VPLCWGAVVRSGESNVSYLPVQQTPSAWDEGGSLETSGGAEGTRTPDLLNAIQTRSQLRHSPRILTLTLLIGRLVELRGFEPLTSTVRL
jgi:hypothetical protein